MGLLDMILRDQMRRRGRHRRYGHGRRRRPHHRRRGNVQVRFGGCCLPIPLGVFAAGTLATRTLVRRRPR